MPTGPNIYQLDPLPGNQGTGFTANIKLQLLQTYTANRLRDTWVQLGSQSIDYYNKIFNRGAVFKLVNTTTNACPLSGYLFFCNDDVQLQTNFSWSNQIANVNDAGVLDGNIYDSTTGIINKNFTWILSATNFNAITIPFDPTFIPFSDVAQGVGVTANSSVVIPQADLNQILIELGVPFININELEYTPDQILDNMILPAMKEYFKWYPITTRQVYPITNTFFSIPIPPYAFGVETAYVNPIYMNNASASNPFTYFSEIAYGGAPGFPAPVPNINSRRRRGFPDTTALSTMILERAVRQGAVNYGKRQRVATHIQQGVVTGYANIVGNLEITWASFSNQWIDIPFNRQTEVRDLARAYVLRAFGSLRSQANSEIPGALNYEQFITRADQLEANVIELWRASTKAPLVRA